MFCIFSDMFFVYFYIFFAYFCIFYFLCIYGASGNGRRALQNHLRGALGSLRVCESTLFAVPQRVRQMCRGQMSSLCLQWEQRRLRWKSPLLFLRRLFPSTALRKRVSSGPVASMTCTGGHWGPSARDGAGDVTCLTGRLVACELTLFAVPQWPATWAFLLLEPNSYGFTYAYIHIYIEIYRYLIMMMYTSITRASVQKGFWAVHVNIYIYG